MRIAKFAFDYATKHERNKVTAVHKANIMLVNVKVIPQNILIVQAFNQLYSLGQHQGVALVYISV
jgi:isocitrate/isopropylmalate dehydrogenase